MAEQRLSSVAAVTEQRTVASRLKAVNWEPYLLLLPSTIFLLIFFAWPMLRAIGLAFLSDEGQLTLQHVQRMMDDVAFKTALRNTVILLIAIIPLQFVLALAMALLVTAKLRGSSLLIYFYALPIAVSDLAAGIVWFTIFTENGYLNTVLTGLGLLDSPYIFLNIRTYWPLVAVILAEVWRATSIVFVILVAGLQGIPQEYNEAAEIFGANWMTRLRRVTLPLLRPSIQVALILRTILAFQVFAVVVALTGGNLNVLALEAYQWYASYRNPAVAASYATLVLIFSMVISYIYLRALRTRHELT